MKSNKSTKVLLCISLILILVGSFLAKTFNGGSSVKLSRISFETANGTLSGLLYMPKDASAENPKPTVIVTHGYLNSAEMQDANAIELSRRGYVVLALDQYDHGHSDYKNELYSDTSFFGIWLPFWVNSMHDAVAYMYEQPYVLKDEAGNGIIGVTGHSMGGFGTTMALSMDEQEYAETGIRKIFCGLTEGSDFMYTGLVGVTVDVADAAGGGRTQGKVAAQYDEFFFNDPTVEGGTVRHKDFVSTPDGMAFLQQTEPAQADTWYDTSDGGKRIIYEPAQTHPWNHFSKVTTADAISFYTEAFKDYQDGINAIAPEDQIWLNKELCECLALVGFVLFILAVAQILLGLPFFKMANTGELPVQKGAEGAKRWIGLLITIIAILLPAFFFTPLMDDGAGSASVNLLFYGGIVAAIGGLIGIVVLGIGKKSLSSGIGGLFLLAGGALLALIAKTSMYADNAVWTAPGLNSIAYWTIGCALMSLVVMSAVYLLLKDKDQVKLTNYGVVLKPMAIIAGICTAVATVVIAYALLFLVDLLFKTDFRIWTFAFKTFDANILPAISRYLPTFLLFYLISTASITINTNGERTKGFLGYLLAIALNAGGAIIWLANQYGRLFSTGVAAHPGSALSGIVLVAMVPTLSIAAIISRNLYKRTGNIWTPGCLNALLMTTMAVANTMVAFK